MAMRTNDDITMSLFCAMRRETSGTRALGHQCGDFANLWSYDRSSGQNVTDRFGRLQTVPRDAQYNLVVGMEVPGLGESECTCNGHATGGLGEHARRFGEQSDSGDERFVAHVLAATARLAHHLHRERAVCRVPDRDRACDGVRDLRYQRGVAALEQPNDRRAPGSLRAVDPRRRAV